MILEGVYRRFQALRSGKGPIDARFTHQESLAVAQVEPPGFELTRAGRRFILGNNAAITGIANVTSLPTTAAQWVIYNPDPVKTYFFEEIGMYCTSGTPGVGGILLACLFTTPSQGAAAQVAGTSITSASLGSYTSKAICQDAVTITSPAAPNWYVIAENNSPNVGAFPGSGNFANRGVAGRIALPPNSGLGLAVVGLAGTTPLWAPFAQWVEIETDME